MIPKIRLFVAANKRTIMITFELFWILVFLLDRVISTTSAAIPQFIYVNF